MPPARTFVVVMSLVMAFAAAVASAAEPNVGLGFADPVAGTVVDGTGVGTGFTGVLPNTAGDQHAPANLALTQGELRVTSTAGDVAGGVNTQDNALHVSVDGTSGAYRVMATLRGPLGLSQAFQGGGIFVGQDQQNYVKLVAGQGTGGPRLQLFKEVAGATTATNVSLAALGTAARVDLVLEVDPAAGTVTGKYSLDGGPLATVGSTAFAGIGTAGDLAGVMTTNAGSTTPVTFRYDAFLVEPAAILAFEAPEIAYQFPTLNGPAGGKQFPTSIEIGPDGRLYASAQYGRIHVMNLDADNDATAFKVIDEIYDTPNQLFDGSPQPGETGRQVTGIVFDPASTPTNQILYVSHSDPEIFEEAEPGQSEIYPASGRVTKLVLDGQADVVSQQDVVVGLPRSGENHAPNGMDFGPDGWLYLSLGGNTNAGDQAKPFGYFPEVALSASVVRIDPGAIGTDTVDVSAASEITFTDPCGPGESVGNGCSAAADVATSIPNVPNKFELYASGFRNGYDIAWHSNGNLYLNENQHNTGFGGTPGPQTSPAGACTDPSQEVGTPADVLFLVEDGGYHGHPNPARGECELFGGVDPIGTFQSKSSTTGITEYTPATVGPLLEGQLLVTNYAVGKNLQRVKLSADGTQVVEKADIATGLDSPIDVIAADNGDILVAEHNVAPSFASGRITRIRPVPTSGLGCDPIGPTADTDGDGFTDQDEIDNATSRCNPADTPPDFDGDGVSDRNDPDADGDAVPDTADPFQRDPSNGADTTLPFFQGFTTPDAGGWFGTGLTGIQLSTSGGPTATDAAGAPLVGAGGAGGFLQVIATPGTAEGGANSQANALQQGFDARQPFEASTSVVEPFAGGNAEGGEMAGVFFGPGEDDFVRLAVDADGGTPRIELGLETGGAFDTEATLPLALPASQVRLTLQGRPADDQVVARARIGDGPEQTVGTVQVPLDLVRERGCGGTGGGARDLCRGVVQGPGRVRVRRLHDRARIGRAGAHDDHPPGPRHRLGVDLHRGHDADREHVGRRSGDHRRTPRPGHGARRVPGPGVRSGRRDPGRRHGCQVLHRRSWDVPRRERDRVVLGAQRSRLRGARPRRERPRSRRRARVLGRCRPHVDSGRPGLARVGEGLRRGAPRSDP